MRPVLILSFAAAIVLTLGPSACHEEFTAPDQPDLAKVKEKFDIDLSGFVPEADLGALDHDLSAIDLKNNEADLAKADQG